MKISADSLNKCNINTVDTGVNKLPVFNMQTILTAVAEQLYVVVYIMHRFDSGSDSLLSKRLIVCWCWANEYGLRVTSRRCAWSLLIPTRSCGVDDSRHRAWIARYLIKVETTFVIENAGADATKVGIGPGLYHPKWRLIGTGGWQGSQSASVSAGAQSSVSIIADGTGPRWYCQIDSSASMVMVTYWKSW